VYDFSLFLSACIFVAALFLYLRHPAASIFHPATLYLAFHGLVFVLRAITARIYDYESLYKAIGFYPTLWEKTQVVIITNIALVVFLFVSLAVAPDPIRFRQSPIERRKREEWLKYFWFVAIPMGAAGLYALYWQWGLEANSGSLGYVDEISGSRALEATNGYFLILGSTLAPLVAIFAYLNRFRLLSLVPFGAYAILRLGTGNRGDFIASAAMLMILFLFDKRKRWIDWRAVLGGLFALLLFNQVVQDRGAAVRELFGVEGVNTNRVGSDVSGYKNKPLEQMDFANLEPTEFVVYAVPKRTGSYDYFVNNLRIITEPIPRAIWKNKPIGDPVRFFYLYDYGNYIAMALGVPAMGWYSLGYLGVAIWAALFAWLYAYPYRRLCRGPQSNLAVMSYAIMFATAIVSFRDGLLLSIIKQLGAYMLPVAALLLLMRLFRVQPARPELARRQGTPRSMPRARRRAADSAPNPHSVPRAWRHSH
jgi:oligosaccharide repeat unit polymerase